MKKENVFENDSPTLEMEMQTLRPSQQGFQIPFVNGLSINPYPGVPVNPATAPYSQQQGFGNFNGFATQQVTPQYLNPGTIPHPSYPYAGSYIQPVLAGNIAPGFIGNAYPTPYVANQFPGNLPHPATPFMQGQWVNAPYAQPMTTPFAGIPATHSNYGTPNPLQSTPFQPAINIADGQYALVPNQYTNGATRNGSSLLKNGERDFISWFPNVNILESDRAFKIEICVPGVAKENCRINVDKNNILHISGTRRWNQETDAVGFTRKEFNYGSFACTFLMTDNLQKEKITSSCRNGLLIVSIPKKEVFESGEERTFSEISVN